MATMAIEPAVIDVLKAARVEGNRLTLVGNLDRKLYVKVNDVLDRLGGKWSKRDKAHVFPEDVKSVLSEVLDSGKKPHRNPDAFFPTPADVIADMLAEAEIPNGYGVSVLEPSAGDGRIVRAIAGERPNVLLYWVEIDESRASEIKEGAGVIGDFLDAPPPVPAFDRVLMNPPFAVPGNADAYADHVLRAYGLLRPGGRLVAIVPRGMGGRGKAVARLRELVEDCGGIEDVRDDAFSEAGTATRTSLIWINRPSES